VSDAELVEQARQGNDAAFGQLVERYQTAVFRAALAALGSKEEAEDAAQDAFLAAYRKLHMFRGDASFKTWLLAITWRHALDRRGSLMRRLRRVFAVDDAGWPQIEHPAPSQEQALVRRELREQVRAVVKTLPAKYRDALLLSTSGNHTFEEIAGILRVPVGTAKWRVFEARRQLKRKLAGLGYVDE
jgi:RNA polymerase sigma-70 factor (ECF subfamily)